MTKQREPEKIKGLLESVLNRRGYLTACREAEITINWTRIVGERLAQVAECKGVDNGILYIRVPSSAWRQELSFMEKHILESIRKNTQCTSVKRIVFC